MFLNSQSQLENSQLHSFTHAGMGAFMRSALLLLLLLWTVLLPCT